MLSHEEAKSNNFVDRYVLEKLSEEEKQYFEDHFMNCGECLEELELAQSFADALRAPSPPQQLTEIQDLPPQQPTRQRWAVPLLAAAALGLMVLNLHQSTRIDALEGPRATRFHTLTAHRGDSIQEVPVDGVDGLLVFKQPLPQDLAGEVLVSLLREDDTRLWQEQIVGREGLLFLAIDASYFRDEILRMELAEPGREAAPFQVMIFRVVR